MQGRCDNDPLDSSDDVCEICGGEYCQTCLIYPRGRKKKPVCKGCALQNSGLRGGAKTRRRADRRSAKKRREELSQSKGERTSGAFVFFDEEDDHTYDLPDETEESEQSSEKVKRRRVSIGRRKGGDVTATVATEAPVDPDDERSDTMKEARTPEPGHEPVLTRDPTEVLAELSTSRKAEASAPTATELLAKLREDEPTATPLTSSPEPAPSQPVTMRPADTMPVARTTPQVSSSFDATIDPFALTSTEPASPVVQPSPTVSGPTVEPPFASTPAASHVAGPVTAPPPAGPHDLIDPFATPPAPAPAPAPTAAPTPAPVPAPAPAPAPVAHQDRPSLMSRLDSEAPVAAPQKAPMPAWVPPPVTPDPSAVVDEGPMEPALLSRITATQSQPEPEVQQPIPRPQPVPAGQRSGSADIDEDGNWVPPALRGMAPKAEREADTLPRRR